MQILGIGLRNTYVDDVTVKILKGAGNGERKKGGQKWKFKTHKFLDPAAPTCICVTAFSF